MTYRQLALLHLCSVVPALLLGTFLLAGRKGVRLHRVLGRAYLLLMATTALITLWMPAQVGPRLAQHFGFIHLFSALTLYSVPAAYLAARRGDVRAHRANMLGLYVGGLVVAGAFAFMPGRMLHAWLFR